MKIQEIHPYELGFLLFSDNTSANVTVNKAGLVTFKGKTYRQTFDAPYLPEHEPSTFFAKRFQEIKKQAALDDLELDAEKAELAALVEEINGQAH